MSIDTYNSVGERQLNNGEEIVEIISETVEAIHANVETPGGETCTTGFVLDGGDSR